MQFKEELVIIRHGRSEYNTTKTGGLDCGITDFGKHQAKVVGRFLKNQMSLRDFRFFTSPFYRCLVTSNIIAEESGYSFKIHQGLREYINHSGREVKIPNRSDEFANPRFNWLFYPAEGVTYTDEWNERFLLRMQDCHASLPPKSVVVTHGLPALLLAKIAAAPNTASIPVWDNSIDNCSITYIRDGRVVWMGRNLYTEMDEHPSHHKPPIDNSELLSH